MRCDFLLTLTIFVCGFGFFSMGLVLLGCASPYGKLIPEKEMAIYDAESKIRLYERYDKENNTDYNAERIKALNAQIQGLKKAIAEEKKNGQGK